MRIGVWLLHEKWDCDGKPCLLYEQFNLLTEMLNI